MLNNILVTVGIPVYNCENFISLAIKSVLKQTYSMFELIIVDDGSTDSTLDIIYSFDDPRIKVIIDGENKGIAFRLNQLVDLAKGKYFIRMDADDIMFPNRLEKQITYLESHSNVDVIGSSAIVIDDNNNIIGKRNAMNVNSLSAVLRNSIFIHPTVAGKLIWFRENRYLDRFSGVEDYDLWLRSFKKSVFCTIDEPILFYRDPLVLKINTYIFRQRQFRKACWANRILFDDKINLFYKVILYSYLKQILASSLSLLGASSIMVSRRNCSVNENYINILNLLSSI